MHKKTCLKGNGVLSALKRQLLPHHVVRLIGASDLCLNGGGLFGSSHSGGSSTACLPPHISAPVKQRVGQRRLKSCFGVTGAPPEPPFARGVVRSRTLGPFRMASASELAGLSSTVSVDEVEDDEDMADESTTADGGSAATSTAVTVAGCIGGASGMDGSGVGGAQPGALSGMVSACDAALPAGGSVAAVEAETADGLTGAFGSRM